MSISEHLKEIEKAVILARAEAEKDEHYKQTKLPIRLKLLLWDIEELQKKFGEVAE